MTKKVWLVDSVKQFTRYGIVGVINTIITLSTIFILTRIFSVSYLIANAAGYILGFINSFIMNKLWTFKSKRPFTREGIFFILMFGICYSLQFVFLIILKEKLMIAPDYAQIIAMIFYAVINFTGNKLLTFKT
ncbi:GtrA family protein [Candidatus Cloacimonadota bacterium]